VTGPEAVPDERSRGADGTEVGVPGGGDRGRDAYEQRVRVAGAGVGAVADVPDGVAVPPGVVGTADADGTSVGGDGSFTDGSTDESPHAVAIDAASAMATSVPSAVEISVDSSAIRMLRLTASSRPATPNGFNQYLSVKPTQV